MAQNKVQYQQGLSMSEFFDRYGSPQQCEALVRAWRWPRGFVCPRCKVGCNSEFRRQGRLYFQCSGCWRRPKTEPLLRVVPTQN